METGELPMVASVLDFGATQRLGNHTGVEHIRDDFRHATGDTMRDVIGPVTAEPYQICLQRTADR